MAAAPEFTSVMPILAVAEMERAIRFYEEKLGFAVTFRNGGVFAIVRRGPVEIGLTLNRLGASAGKGGCYVKLVGVDAIYGELLANGVKMAHELKTESYRMREFMIVDPDGNTLNFGEPQG